VRDLDARAPIRITEPEGDFTNVSPVAGKMLSAQVCRTPQGETRSRSGTGNRRDVPGETALGRLIGMACGVVQRSLEADAVSRPLSPASIDPWFMVAVVTGGRWPSTPVGATEILPSRRFNHRRRGTSPGLCGCRF
jgi:hypothetical protein